MQRSALCRSQRELSNAYLLANFGFDTAENEPSKVCHIPYPTSHPKVCHMSLHSPGAHRPVTVEQLTRPIRGRLLTTREPGTGGHFFSLRRAEKRAEQASTATPRTIVPEFTSEASVKSLVTLQQIDQEIALKFEKCFISRRAVGRSPLERVRK